MALTDEQLQVLQGEVTDKCKKDASNTIIDDKTGQEYQIIHKTDSATQAIAVVPVKYDNSGKEYVDYSETTIVVAGTRNDSNLNLDVWKARIRAGVSRGGMTEQYCMKS